MRKLICLVFAMLLCSCVAGAENTSETEYTAYTVAETINQDYYVGLHLIFEQENGQLKEVTVQAKAFTVQYAFDLYKDPTTGACTGFSYDPEKVTVLVHDSLQEVTPFQSLMNLTASIKETPENFAFTGKTDGYYMQVSGGRIELNYNRVLRFNIFGELVEATPVKEKRSFFYSNIPYPVPIE